jgi:hypothetical protein
MADTVDRKHLIDISKPWHVAYWAQTLGVSDTKVVEAVQAVGPNAHAVSSYLTWTPHQGSQSVYRADAMAASTSPEVS